MLLNWLITVPSAEADQRSSGGLARQLRRLGERPWAVFTVIFLLTTLLKISTIDDPAAWDAAMSVFPAAGVMSESGFDVFSQPGYAEGGANVHALSLVTVLTAVLIRLFGQTPLELLHIIHFGLTALGLTGLFLLARRYVGAAIATLIAFTSLLLQNSLDDSGLPRRDR